MSRAPGAGTARPASAPVRGLAGMLVRVLALAAVLVAVPALAQDGDLKVSLKGAPVFPATVERATPLRTARDASAPEAGRLDPGQQVKIGYLRQGWAAVFPRSATSPAESQARGYVPVEALRLPGLSRTSPAATPGAAGRQAPSGPVGGPPAAPKAPAAPALSPEEAARTLHVVHVAAFADAATARAVAGVLRKQGFDPKVLLVDGREDDQFHVLALDALPDPAKARSLAEAYLARTGKKARVNTMTRGAWEAALQAAGASP